LILIERRVQISRVDRRSCGTYLVVLNAPAIRYSTPMASSSTGARKLLQQFMHAYEAGITANGKPQQKRTIDYPRP